MLCLETDTVLYLRQQVHMTTLVVQKCLTIFKQYLTLQIDVQFSFLCIFLIFSGKLQRGVSISLLQGSRASDYYYLDQKILGQYSSNARLFT